MDNVSSFMPPEKLVSVFEAEARNLLRKHEVYAIGPMGYLDSETRNPHYLGICHWIEKPRVDLESAYFDFETQKNVSQFNVRATDEEIELQTISADIEGLFDLSYLSIGQLLVIFEGSTGVSRYKKFAGQPIKLTPNDKSLYWLNYNSTIIHLSTLSDRLFKYLVQTFYLSGIDIDRNESTDFDHNVFYKVKHYVTHFSAPVQIDFKKLKSLAKKVKDRKKIRNSMIHEVSTDLARIEKSFVSSSQLADQHGLLEKNITKENCSEEIEEVNTPVELCKSWYSDLIELANMIFLIEKQSRI